MKAIDLILQAEADGCLRLPLPKAMSQGRYRVTATIEPVDGGAITYEENRRQLREALERLAKLNPFRDIKDPVAWQREIREDRPLPFRE